MTIPGETPDPSPAIRPTKRYALLAFAITLFGLLLQMPCLRFDKVIDDFDLVYSVEQRGCGANPIDCFHHPVFELYYRPLFTATFALGDQLHAKASIAANSLTHQLHVNMHGYRFQAHDTFWYHLENLALHAAVCGLAFWFFLLLFQRERPALLAGLVFALHPLQVSVTSFIGGRPDSMALLFLLLFSIGAWNAAQHTFSPRPLARRVAWLLLSIVGYSCAVFTKEQCLSMLLILPFLLWRPGSVQTGRPGSVFREKYLLPLYLLPVGLYLWAARQVIPFASVPNPHWKIPLHLEMIGRTLWYFQRLLLLPTVGPIHQSTLGPWDTPQPVVACTGYLLALLWLIAVWRFRRHPAFRFCALWTTLTLFPVLNLVPIPSQFASCYRAVIPLLGFAGVLGLALDHIPLWWQAHLQNDRYATYDGGPKQPFLVWLLHSRLMLHQQALGRGVVLSLCIFYSCETLADVSTWQDNNTLMQAEIYGDPNFVPAYGGLAFWNEGTRGQAPVRLPNWKKAEENFSAVLSPILPDVPPGPAFLNAVNSDACQRTLWSHAGLRYHPRVYLTSLLPHRGWARQEQGHFAAAAEDYRRELVLKPEDDNTRANLRNCYMANGQVDEAIALYRSASEVPPRSDSNTDHTSP